LAGVVAFSCLAGDATEVLPLPTLFLFGIFNHVELYSKNSMQAKSDWRCAGKIVSAEERVGKTGNGRECLHSSHTTPTSTALLAPGPFFVRRLFALSIVID
jgi:hypothetical protein